MAFLDRRDAGRRLAEVLTARYGGRTDVVVLALPRGGVPVGYEVATALHAPLDVYLVRKLGAPGREELALGAVASGGVRVLNDAVLAELRVPAPVLEQITAQAHQELERREQSYRDDRPLPDLTGRTVLLVDDGLATGASMRAAVVAVRHLQPAAVVVAVPVGQTEVCAALREVADDAVCILAPRLFRAVGLWYDDFSEVSDQEVRLLLQVAASAQQG